MNRNNLPLVNKSELPVRWDVLFQVVEQSPTTILITDPEGRIEYANPRLTELTGYTLDEVKGKTPGIFKSGFTDSDVYEQLWTTIKSGKEWRGQFINRRKDGTLFWEDIRISPVIDETGTIQHFVAIKEDVTTYKEIESALYESEARFRRTFEQAAVGMAHIALDGTFLLINQKFCDLTGYTHSELLTKSFRDITHPDDLDIGFNHIQLMLSQEIDNYTFEKRYIRKDETVQWVELHISIAYDQSDQPQHFISIVQDISRRKAAIEALKQSEYDLKRSQSIAHVGSWVWDIATNKVRWSDEMHQIFGVNKLDTMHDLDHIINRAIHPDDRARVIAANQAVINQRQPNALEYRIIHPDGSLRYAWAQPGDMVLDTDGNVISLYGIVQDVTERKLAELAIQTAHEQLAVLHQTVRQQNTSLEQTVKERTHQLRRLNDRMATILNNISDAIVVLDADNKIENTNLAFNRQFGYLPDEVFGQAIDIIAAPDSKTDIMRARKDICETHQTVRTQITAQSKDGKSFDADVALAYIQDNHGHIICSIRDITHLKELERAKDAFISMISHELRTPLTSIMLGVKTLIHYYDRLPDARRLQKLDQILIQTDTMTELVAAILDTTRYDMHQTPLISELVDVRQVLHDILVELQPQIDANHQNIEMRSIPESIVMPGERADIARIWRNLISNAVKYAGNRSKIQIQLYAPILSLEMQSPPPLIKAYLPSEIMMGNYVIGLVSDDGPGIPENDISELFTRFYRGWATETDISGTGLGLSLVKDIVKMYGGDISVHSVLGSGATSYFWLPLTID